MLNYQTNARAGPLSRSKLGFRLSFRHDVTLSRI